MTFSKVKKKIVTFNHRFVSNQHLNVTGRLSRLKTRHLLSPQCTFRKDVSQDYFSVLVGRKCVILCLKIEPYTQATNNVTILQATDQVNEQFSRNEKQPEKLSVSSTLKFKCDQFDYTNDSEKGIRQHVRIKHRISQLNGHDDIEIEDWKSEKNPCPL